MPAIREAHRAGLLARQHVAANVTAGIIVGIVALPLAMAFAIASGARPEQGIYTAIVAGAVVSLFGGSRVQIAGPTGAFIALLSGITARYGIAGLQMATLIAGALLLLMGVLRLGRFVEHIPRAVIVGFTAGIGVIIVMGQAPAFIGAPAPSGDSFLARLPELAAMLGGAHTPTLLVGLSAFLAAAYSPYLPLLRRVPAPLLALLVASLAHALLAALGGGAPTGVATIGSTYGGIPRGLPSWSPLTFDLSLAAAVFPAAVSVALLGAIESLLCAVVADRMTGTRHRSDQELVGQGLANLLTPLFGGFAATGAIARTATNIRHGATSPLAGIVHALTLLAIVLVAAPLAAEIPLAALAAILFVVAWNMSDVPAVAAGLRRGAAADRVVLAVTLLLTVAVDLVTAVAVGVAISALAATPQRRRTRLQR